MTMYKHLKKMYGEKLVEALFNKLELDKSRPIPIEWQRGQGNTMFAGLVMVLEKHVNGREFVIVNSSNIEEVPSENRMDIEDMRTHECTVNWVYTALQETLKHE